MSRDMDPLCKIYPHILISRPNIAYSLWYFWRATKKIYGCLLVRPLMLKRNRAKISKSRPKVAKFWWFSGAGVPWYKKFQFLLQKAHPCLNPRRLSHFAWRLVEGSDPQVCPWKKQRRKSQKLPLKWCVAVNTGLHSRAPVIGSVINEVFRMTCADVSWWHNG